ncbi:YbhB/YbcL family Raf kinase inhibitor-like protein [Candidatus Dojkabacteria bacterium]|nr:YbhB/YbcL family Raf kinase inhibitor-like protein [Candidatus Dojkabacteria bacterium]
MDKSSSQNPTSTRNFSIFSTAFKDGEKIPVQYCTEKIPGGANISIPLSWENAPEQTGSFLLVIVDTHPVAKNWIHWIVKDISLDTTNIEACASKKNLPFGASELSGTEGIKGYQGPQPPVGSGDHPYEAHLFALNTVNLELPKQPTWEEIQSVVAPFLISEAVLTGYYGR